MQPERIGKKIVLEYASKQSGISMSVLKSAYNAIFSSITDMVISNNEISLAGFGKFYPQLHKGHPVQMGVGKLDDYMCFKFSASSTLNEKMRLDNTKVQNEVNEFFETYEE